METHKRSLSFIEFYDLATSKAISGRVPTCDDADSFSLFSAAPQGNQATSTITQYPTQSHYPDTDITNPCPMLLIVEYQARKQQV